MTRIPIGGMFRTGSIDGLSLAGPGQRTDDPPSAVRATTPGAKHQAAMQGSNARCFDATEGQTMRILRKSSYATAARLSPALQLRFEAAGNGVVDGYASTFGGPPDSFGDIVAPGAFSRTLREHRAEGTMPAMLWSHNPAEPIGKWLEISEDARGLRVRGQLNLATNRGRDAHAHLADGDVSGLSIGFAVGPNGSRRDGGANLLTDIDLVEVSVVLFPANRRARIESVKTKSELVDLLREAGLAKQAANKIAAGGWPALAGEDHQKAIDLAASIERATAQLRTSK